MQAHGTKQVRVARSVVYQEFKCVNNTEKEKRRILFYPGEPFVLQLYEHRSIQYNIAQYRVGAICFPIP